MAKQSVHSIQRLVIVLLGNLLLLNYNKINIMGELRTIGWDVPTCYQLSVPT